MENEKIKAWITTRALTAGILEIFSDTLFENDVGVRDARYGWVCKRDFHRTQEAAIARAEEMRAEKIAELERKIERLKKLEFKV